MKLESSSLGARGGEGWIAGRRLLRHCKSHLSAVEDNERIGIISLDHNYIHTSLICPFGTVLGS
eukprot:scaffold642_cov166-Ochromonas_danica.AAC.9